MLLIVCANGGHLAEMRIVADRIDADKLWVTFSGLDSEDISGIKMIDFHNRALKMISLIPIAIWVVLRKRVSCMLSTGGMISIPFAFMSKLFRIPVIYFECGTKIKRKSGTGRVMYHLADHFIVQSEFLLQVYGRKAKYLGALI